MQPRLLLVTPPNHPLSQQFSAADELAVLENQWPRLLEDRDCIELLLPDRLETEPLAPYLPLLSAVEARRAPQRLSVGLWVSYGRGALKTGLPGVAALARRYHALQGRYPTGENEPKPAILLQIDDTRDDWLQLPPVMLALALLIRLLPGTPLFVDAGMSRRFDTSLEILRVNKISLFGHARLVLGDDAIYLTPPYTTAEDIFLAPAL